MKNITNVIFVLKNLPQVLVYIPIRKYMLTKKNIVVIFAIRALTEKIVEIGMWQKLIKYCYDSYRQTLVNYHQ